jgi:hypothetical protein
MIDKERLGIFLEPPNQRDGQVRDLPYFGKRILGKFFALEKSHSGILSGSFAQGCAKARQPRFDLDQRWRAGWRVGIGKVHLNGPRDAE